MTGFRISRGVRQVAGEHGIGPGRLGAGLRALVIDPNPGDAERLQRLIANSDPESTCAVAGTLDDGMAEAGAPDVVFLDDSLPGDAVLRAIEALLDASPRCAIILTLTQGDEALATSALLRGAVDYIPKRRLSEGAVRRMLKVGTQTALMRWKIEQQREELTTFANVLVHDFRAPIIQVSCMAELLAESLRDGDTEATLKELAMLQKSARQMAELVDSLSALLRSDQVPRLEKVTADALNDRAMTALARTIAQADAVIEIAPAPYEITCNPPQIAQLLQNLLANSIKFSCGVRPHVRVSVVQDGADHLRFSVSDNGIGVPARFQDAIFEPFRRLRPSDDIPGSGLGLATCKKIVERHGGTIWCMAQESKPVEGSNPGTTICFRLPRHLAPAEQAQAAQGLASGRRSG